LATSRLLEREVRLTYSSAVNKQADQWKVVCKRDTETSSIQQLTGNVILVIQIDERCCVTLCEQLSFVYVAIFYVRGINVYVNGYEKQLPRLSVRVPDRSDAVLGRESTVCISADV